MTSVVTFTPVVATDAVHPDAFRNVYSALKYVHVAGGNVPQYIEETSTIGYNGPAIDPHSNPPKHGRLYVVLNLQLTGIAAGKVHALVGLSAGDPMDMDFHMTSTADSIGTSVMQNDNPNCIVGPLTALSSDWGREVSSTLVAEFNIKADTPNVFSIQAWFNSDVVGDITLRYQLLKTPILV